MITLEQHLAAHPLYYNEDEWKTSPWVCKCKWTPTFDPADEFFEDLDDGEITGQHAAHVAATWREARTVRAVEELDALPFLTIIREVYGQSPSGYDYGGVHERRTSGWECIAGVLRDTPNPIRLPALILWTPEVQA